MDNSKALVILNTLTLVVMLVANYAYGAGSFGLTTVGEISNKYDTLFTPAGYAFIIWSLIFLLCIGFVAYQWILIKSGDPRQYIKRTGIWLALSNVINTLWLYCWTNELILLSVLLILILMLCLVALTVRLRLELDDEPVRTIFFVWWPIVYYLGWIMVASIANIAAWLVSKGWKGEGFGEEVWTIIMIATSTLLYLFLLKTRNMREAAGVGIWAFIAIAVKQWQFHNNIAMTAISVSVILFVAIVIHGYRNREFSPAAKIKRGEWK